MWLHTEQDTDENCWDDWHLQILHTVMRCKPPSLEFRFGFGIWDLGFWVFSVGIKLSSLHHSLCHKRMSWNFGVRVHQTCHVGALTTNQIAAKLSQIAKLQQDLKLLVLPSTMQLVGMLWSHLVLEVNLKTWALLEVSVLPLLLRTPSGFLLLWGSLCVLYVPYHR